MTATHLERLRERLDSLELDALLVTTPSNRRWLAAFTGSAGTVLAGRGVARFATDSRYWEQAAIQAPGFELVQVVGAMVEWAPQLLDGMGERTVGFEPAGLSVADHAQWSALIESLPAAEQPAFAPAPKAIEALRMVKDGEEIEALTRAVRLGDDACRHAISVIRPGMTEQQLAWEIQRYAMEHGADALSFDTIIAGGEWGALPHARPRDVPLREGEPVVMDLGVRVDGYCSDLTRTVCIGEPDARFREIYDIVLTAQEMARGAHRGRDDGSAGPRDRARGDPTGRLRRPLRPRPRPWRGA